MVPEDHQLLREQQVMQTDLLQIIASPGVPGVVLPLPALMLCVLSSSFMPISLLKSYTVIDATCYTTCAMVPTG